MAIQNLLIMNLLRIITPEEIADIATKHNGGKFLSLTDLVNERVDRQIYRDFSSTNAIDMIHEEHASFAEQAETAKILPFKKSGTPEQRTDEEKHSSIGDSGVQPRQHFVSQAIVTSQEAYEDDHAEVPAVVEHVEDENMSSFILVEKERLKQSQKSLKKKEIISLYQKNSNIDLEQIKSSNQDAGTGEAGVLVNKKQY
ncbi:MAG: hypothetical protein K2Q18_09700 [Bdellovibrionales bacterium]|nr:hypothetical protein [Bdellovibrionales bacterium]